MSEGMVVYDRACVCMRFLFKFKFTLKGVQMEQREWKTEKNCVTKILTSTFVFPYKRAVNISKEAG